MQITERKGEVNHWGEPMGITISGDSHLRLPWLRVRKDEKEDLCGWELALVWRSKFVMSESIFIGIKFRTNRLIDNILSCLIIDFTVIALPVLLTADLLYM